MSFWLVAVAIWFTFSCKRTITSLNAMLFTSRSSTDQTYVCGMSKFCVAIMRFPLCNTDSSILTSTIHERVIYGTDTKDTDTVGSGVLHEL
jgi:hypothetical protein